jgi:hypothetical protein
MAKNPTPGGVQRGVVRPSNETGPGGNRANNGYLPLVSLAHPGVPPHVTGGDRRNGCVPLGGMPSPVHPPDHRFNVKYAKMPQPPSAIEPGRGEIPVDPWDAAGRPNRVVAEPVLPREPR